MPAKWQQWMPFKIEKFWSSPSVQAMSHAAQIGYLRLLGCQWQSIDGAVSPDPFDLAEQSGLGDEAWTQHGPRILRKFIVLKDGRLRNLPNYEDWCEAKRIFEARKTAALNTVRTRLPKGHRTVTVENTNGHRTVSVGSPLCSADTITGTVTNTNTEEQKQIPSPNPRKRSSEVKHSKDPRHIACKAEIFSYYREHNDGEDPDWEGREGRALGMFLAANPKLTEAGMKKLLKHRADSIVNHSERPALWIAKLTSFRMAPLNEYGKPLNGNNGSNGHGTLSTAELRSQRRDATFAEAERILAAEKLAGARGGPRG